MDEYTEGVCFDGATILKSGVSLSISELLEICRERDKLQTENTKLQAEVDSVREYADRCGVLRMEPTTKGLREALNVDEQG